jgi:ribosome-associated toxin RatA of RatAB toxin-antitoxin module
MLPVALLFLAQAPSQDLLTPMLSRGPLALVEQTKDGRFSQATAVVLVNAPVEKVYEAVLAQDKFKTYMPKVLESELTNSNAKGFDIRLVLDVPGPDTDYTIHYARDDDKRVLKGTWKKGDLKDSKWEWRMEPTPEGKTLLFHQLTVKNFSSILSNLEDDQQTITVGVNVASAIAATKAVKNHLENPAPADGGTK